MKIKIVMCSKAITLVHSPSFVNASITSPVYSISVGMQYMQMFSLYNNRDSGHLPQVCMIWATLERWLLFVVTLVRTLTGSCEFWLYSLMVFMVPTWRTFNKKTKVANLNQDLVNQLSMIKMQLYVFWWSDKNRFLATSDVLLYSKTIKTNTNIIFPGYLQISSIQLNLRFPNQFGILAHVFKTELTHKLK